ncbi:hypothetical protein CA85_06540 [Allorhodopirellula solitaria]|uniref:Uncharacterized protein n=1 Tax=Allorhodopirellula solitaria TaxID=2527987 RepID=A0A5C5YKC9_9BACT|nr:hypothetical protein CA85_06540 [Allorhodopirellula solitaria]
MIEHAKPDLVGLAESRREQHPSHPASHNVLMTSRSDAKPIGPDSFIRQQQPLAKLLCRPRFVQGGWRMPDLHVVRNASPGKIRRIVSTGTHGRQAGRGFSFGITQLATFATAQATGNSKSESPDTPPEAQRSRIAGVLGDLSRAYFLGSRQAMRTTFHFVRHRGRSAAMKSRQTLSTDAAGDGVQNGVQIRIDTAGNRQAPQNAPFSHCRFRTP